MYIPTDTYWLCLHTCGYTPCTNLYILNVNTPVGFTCVHLPPTPVVTPVPLRVVETPDRSDKDGAEGSVPLHPSAHVLDSLRPAGTQQDAILDYHILYFGTFSAYVVSKTV